MGVVVPVPPTLREPIEIELAPKGRVRIALTDGTTPISGATVELGDFVHQWFAAERRSDDAGHVEIAAIDTEHAVVDVKGAGLWRDKFVVASSESDAYIPLQVRRTGGVELEVRSVAGAAIVDAPVALRSLEFDVDVADWIAAGRVVAPAGGLRTDPSGRVRVEGLPHGPYRASVGGGSSTVEVPAHAVGHAQLFVP
jgi:hypothetical protein